jgi:broad specificity phosphatase PhoE
MTDVRRIHVIRQGEVTNPDGIIYGRLPHFSLSEAGHAMAERTAVALHTAGIPITRIVSSPLLRTRQSAAPLAKLYQIPVSLDERLIEAGNRFEGRRMTVPAILTTPRDWPLLANPFTPSWGEPYTDILTRMLEALHDMWDTTPAGDIAVLTHQLPIWTMHRHAAGQPLAHNPYTRRCALSSVTSFTRIDGIFHETGYLVAPENLRPRQI